MELHANIFKTIKRLYPENVNYINDIYEDTEEICNNVLLITKFTEEKKGTWIKFKNDLDKQNINIIDYSILPNKNSCINFELFLGKFKEIKYYAKFYISPIYPAYCFLTSEFDGNLKKVTWNINDDYFVEKKLVVLELINRYFENYQLLSFDILKTVVQNYSVDPFLISKAKIFNLLFTFDPVFDKFLIE